MAHWEIENKSFLITGGASGLGALYTQAFLKEGAQKVFILDINELQGVITAERLNHDFPNKVVFIKCDMSNEKNISEAFKRTLEDVKYIDVIVNNAGIMNDSPETWAKMIAVNFQRLVSMSLKGVEHMSMDNSGCGGTIINVSSILGLARLRQLPIYGGTKMATVHFTQSLAASPGHKGVRIMTLCLGGTDTPLLHNFETKSYSKQTCEELKMLRNMDVYQRPKSAVAAVLKMYKEGVSRSVWLSSKDAPGRDITGVIDSAYKQFATAKF